MQNWNVNDPHKVGIDDALFSKAIYFAIPNELIMDRDLGAALEQGHIEDPWPIGKTIGTIKRKKLSSAAILRGGEFVKTWDDVDYVDMTFSISKSYLSLAWGLRLRMVFFRTYTQV